jgi:hypothetical protein
VKLIGESDGLFEDKLLSMSEKEVTFNLDIM